MPYTQIGGFNNPDFEIEIARIFSFPPGSRTLLDESLCFFRSTTGDNRIVDGNDGSPIRRFRGFMEVGVAFGILKRTEKSRR